MLRSFCQHLAEKIKLKLMAHIIEVERRSEVEARSFLDALFYSDSVSAIGNRLQMVEYERLPLIGMEMKKVNSMSEFQK